MPDLKHLKVKGTTYDIKDESKVENVAYDSNNKAITKTIDGTTTNVVTADQLIGSDVTEAVTDWLDDHVAAADTLAVDDTLTIHHAAADAKAVGDRIDDLVDEFSDVKSAFGTQNLSPGITSFEKGNISADGTEINDDYNKRIRRRSTLIQIDDDLIIQGINGFGIAIHYYDSNGTHLGYMPSSGFYTVPIHPFSNYPSATKMRIVVATASDTTATITENDSTKYCRFYSAIDEIQSFEKGYKSTSFTDSLLWEQGSIDGSTGNHTASDYRIRSQFIKVTAPIRISAIDTNRVCYHYYDSNKVHKGYISWTEMDAVITPDANKYYIRVLCAGRQDDVAVTPGNAKSYCSIELNTSDNTIKDSCVSLNICPIIKWWNGSTYANGTLNLDPYVRTIRVVSEPIKVLGTIRLKAKTGFYLNAIYYDENMTYLGQSSPSWQTDVTVTKQVAAYIRVTLGGGSGRTDLIYASNAVNMCEVNIGDAIFKNYGESITCYERDNEEYMQMQGGCLANNYFYFIQIYENTIFKVNIKTKETISRRYSDNLYHANDMTYNPTIGKIYVTTMREDGAVGIIDPDTLAVEEFIYPEVSGSAKEYCGIAYDRKNTRYYLTDYNDLDKCYIFNSGFEYVSTITYTNKSNTSIQGIETDGTYIYQLRGIAEGLYATLDVYKFTGELVSAVQIPKAESLFEPENVMYDWDGNYYMGVIKSEVGLARLYYTFIKENMTAKQLVTASKLAL